MKLQAYIADMFDPKSLKNVDLGFKPKIGSNIFIGFMPSNVDSGLLITNTLPLVKDHYTGLINGRIKMLYRSKSPDEADLIMRRISKFLTVMDVGNVKDVKVLKMLPVHEPYAYPRQDTGGFEASVNFDVTYTYCEDS